MSRSNLPRLTLLLAVFALTGCQCGQNEPTCNDATVTFDVPAEGATVPDTFDVKISAAANGAPFSFDAATLSVQGHTFTGTVSGGSATFSGVTASAGTAELTASIAKGTCSKSVKRTVTVRQETCTAPTVLAVSFPQDTGAPLGVLNASELPSGVPLSVKVEAGCVAGAQVRIKRGATVVGALTDFTNGVATVTLPTLPDADSAQYDLFAELVRDGGPINMPNGAALASIRVQRASPTCALTVNDVVGPAQDAQPTVAGFQARITGTMAADSTGTIQVVNVSSSPVTPNMMGEVSADFTLPSTTATYALLLSCVDTAGNTTTTTGTLQTDFDAPDVTIVTPANAATVSESPLTMTVNVGNEAGGSLQVLVNGQSVDAITLDGSGVAHPVVSFSSDGTYALTVRVTDRAGNTTEETVTVTVALDGCGMAFTRPASSPALLTPAQLQTGTYSFQTASKPECVGQAATLFRTEVFADGGTSTEQQVGSATLSATGVADFSPLTVASGSFRYRGSVVNPGDAGTSGVTIQVMVDLDGPSITNPVVPSGQTAVTLSTFQDSQASTPGVQRTLDYSARVPAGGRVDVCTTQGIDPVSMSQRPTSAECGSGWFLLQQGVPSPSPSFTFPEGSYSIKVVVVGGGVSPAPASPAIAVVSDATKPCVQANSLTLPQDTNGDRRLNIAELNGAQPVFIFTPGCGDVPATLSATSPVTVRDLVAGSLGGTRPSTATYASGQYTVTLTGAYTTDVDLNLFVQLTDQVFNMNGYAGAGDPAVISFRVDPVAPTCSIGSPSAPVLGLAQVPGGSLDVTVNTGTDVASGGVQLTFTGKPDQNVTPAQGAVTTQFTGLTGDSTVTIGATCTDASGNSATATPVTTRIDLAAPTCDLTAPADGALLVANEVTTTVATTGIADGEVVIITSSLSGISNNQLTVASNSATRAVRYPKNTQTVTATYADEAGNECVAPTGGHKSISITVTNASCSLDFASGGPINTNANGSWLNRAGAGVPDNVIAPATGNAAVRAVTADCGLGKNVYLYAGPASATPSGTPQVTDLTGNVTFPSQAFNEGGEYTVTIDDGFGNLSHRSFIVSLKAPTVGGLALQRSSSVTTLIPVQKDAALTFGAFTGNNRVATAIATDMVFGDLNSSVDGADLKLAVSNIDGARVTPFDSKLEVLGVTTPASVTVDVDGFNSSLDLKLPHQLGANTVSMVIRVTNPAGNTYTSTHVSQVDVIAPGAITVTQTLTAARTATVNLSWAAVNDDGSNGASGAASYDVRWSTSSVPGNDSLLQEADFFSDVAKQEGVTAATSRSLTLPPLNTYYIAARAVDEVGNYATYAAPTALANTWSEIVLTVAGAPTDFGHTVLLNSNVTGSSEKDIIISAPSRGNVGSVYVFTGSAGLASQSTCGTGCQELTPPDNTGTFFGGDVSSAGNLGDDATDSTTANMADIVVGQRSYSTIGRVFVFFGSTGNITRSIEIRGDANNLIGWTATAIADLDNDGLGEIAIPAYLYGGGRGRVYIFKGRSFAQWQAAFAPSQQYIDINSANWVIEAEFNINTANASNGFGLNRNGVITLPGVTGRTFNGTTPAPELLVSIPRANVSKFALYAASQVTSSSPAAPLPAFDGGVQVISGALTNSNSIVQGLGTAAWGAGPVQRSDLADLYVGYPLENRVYRYSAWSATGVAGGAATESFLGYNNFGANVTSGDLNGDGKSDLMVAEGVATNNGLWVLYQRAGSFDNSVGPGHPQFNVSQIRPVRVGGLTSSMPNRLVAVGDFGAGVSLLYADVTTGSVHVWK